MLFKKGYIDLEVSGEIIIGQEWLEFRPSTPLTVERTLHELRLFPSEAIQMIFDDNGDLVPKDRPQPTIECELSDVSGTRYSSEPHISESWSGDLKVTSRRLRFNNLPKDAKITTVRIKSTVDYPIKKIIWRCYDWSDVHK